MPRDFFHKDFKGFYEKIPLWLKQTFMEFVELAVIALAEYGYQVLLTDTAVFDWKMAVRIVALKVLAKFLRAHPNTPVPDYVNSIK